MAVEKQSLIDAFIGSRIRTRRLALGLSYKELGDAIGVTPQEVLDYECGADRVGASQLVHIAEALETEPGFFLQDESLEPADARASCAELDPHNVSGFIASAEGLELIKAFILIEDPELRRHIVALVKKINSSVD